MNGQDFLRIAKEAFAPFLEDLGFSMAAPAISGKSYRASFTGPRHAVWVSFEPGDDAFVILVFGRENGELSDIDDPLKTPRLSDLNRRYMGTVTNDERVANDAVFKSVVAQDKEERLLLKRAKELRLLLPKYLANQ